MKPTKPGMEEAQETTHKIRITLSSKNVTNLEKGTSFLFLLLRVLWICCIYYFILIWSYKVWCFFWYNNCGVDFIAPIVGMILWLKDLYVQFVIWLLLMMFFFLLIVTEINVNSMVYWDDEVGGSLVIWMCDCIFWSSKF